jgi:hypothetical protein
VSLAHEGMFGKRDWVANGAIFALYHLHMPWAILPTLVDGIFLDAYPSRRFQSAWMGIIVHSAQSVLLVGLFLAPCWSCSKGSAAAAESDPPWVAGRSR